jgi:hypothetical protein
VADLASTSGAAVHYRLTAVDETWIARGHEMTIVDPAHLQLPVLDPTARDAVRARRAKHFFSTGLSSAVSIDSHPSSNGTRRHCVMAARKVYPTN